MKRRSFVSGLILPLLATAGNVLSAEQRKAAAAGEPSATLVDPSVVQATLQHHAAMAHACCRDVLSLARDMQSAIKTFLRKPSDARLRQARRAWRLARARAAQCQVFVANTDDAQWRAREERIEAWPVNEHYIDYVEGDDNGGLINDPHVPLTREGLLTLHRKQGEENVALGWHAIEFMLWGQDISDEYPGDRPFKDYVLNEGRNADRRRQYLSLTVSLLISDLESKARDWAPGVSGNWRARFIRNGQRSLRQMLQAFACTARHGIASGQIDAPLSTQDQEDEHSAFSDNSHADIVNGVLGLQNVWLGHYRPLNGNWMRGAALVDLVAQADEKIAARVAGQLEFSYALARAIPYPFDLEIIGSDDAIGRHRLLLLSNSLHALSEDCAKASRSLGLGPLDLEACERM